MMPARPGLFAIVLWAAASTSAAAPPASVLQAPHAADRPWDKGGALVVTWQNTMPVDFTVHVRRLGGAEPVALGPFPISSEQFIDSGLTSGIAYVYELAVHDPDGNQVSVVRTSPAQPRPNLFDLSRADEAILIALLFAVFLWGTFRGSPREIRPIAGVTAMEEAMGRAVEMGKPVLFSIGWGAQLDKPATLAALNLFGYIARKAASYGARLLFPAHDAVIMAAAQESASAGARLEGRPELYREEDIYYVTGSQFGYAAALDGILCREKPAATFWIGTFAAESLILSETGNQVGAVQIAGTDSTIQLAFFLVTCDYTLIGEEMFAASAYLTRDPKAQGALWSQDVLKVVVATVLVVGLVAALLNWHAVGNFLRGF